MTSMKYFTLKVHIKHHNMKFLVVLSAVVACAFAKPGGLVAPGIGAYGYGALGYSALGYGAPGIASPLGYAAHVGVPAVAAHVGTPALTAAYAAPAVAAAYAAPAVAAPVAYAAPAPVAVAAPVSVHTQYHAQDELGQASYGHAEPFQTHNAIQDAAGNKVGSFSYLSPEGNVFKTDYVADGLGYRVASNALPVGPSVPVGDTPEVVAAKAAHFAAHTAVLHRRKRQIIGHTPAATVPLGHIAAPLAYAAPYAVPYAHSVAPLAAPLAYSAPAVRPGILTTIVNNPGHAVSYRVD